MKKKLGVLLLFLPALLVWLPVLIMAGNSFMGAKEIADSFGGVYGGGENVKFSLLPMYPTLKPFVELLLDSPNFFVMFWNSCRQVFPILLGQLAVGIPAAWAFGRFEFPGRKLLFTVYMILMIMPFQVTMVSSYLVLKQLHFIDTHLAVIVPGIFSTFPVFIMTKFFKGIPRTLIEAAQIDGACEVRIFMAIGVPIGAPGVISAVILGFLEYWNAMEPPLTFLRDRSLWPLSLYLPEIVSDKVSVSFAASAVMMIPAVLLFLWGQSYLEQGIVASGLKE